MLAERVGRMPGLRFEAQAPPPPTTLPRMDVGAFVGFAASGPVDVPVEVESLDEYAAVFGADVALAWDAQRGRAIPAQLGPAVRAFFRAGGRRAWVVRVAGRSAGRNAFPVPGLARLAAGDLAPARLPARAVGSWSDGLRVGATLESAPLLIVDPGADDLSYVVELAARETVVAGDLLRLRGRDDELLFAVRSAVAESSARLARGRVRVSVSGDPESVVRLRRLAPPLGATGQACLRPATSAATALATVVGGDIGSPPQPDEVRLRLAVAAPPSAAPERGTLIRVDGLAAEQLWLVVDDVRTGQLTDSPPVGTLRIVGQPFWVVPPATPGFPVFGRADSAERLTFTLGVVGARGGDLALGGLGFAQAHPRYAGALPTDEELYASALPVDRELYDPAPPGSREADRRAELWRDVGEPRFPLAGFRDGAPLLVPFGMPLVPDVRLGPEPSPAPAPVRDGLERLADDLFLDDSLRDPGVDALLARADFLRYGTPRPRPLRGLHALLAVEEVTLVAAPDACQRGWTRTPPVPPPPHAPSEPTPRPDTSRFGDCGARVLATPRLEPATPDATGTFELAWSDLDEDGARYVVQETHDPESFEDATTLYEGAELSWQVQGRAPGAWYYRVRAEGGGNVSDWSPPLTVLVAPPERWLAGAEGDYSPSTLLSVQRALLRMCAARGDLLCVLSLPEHYREEAALAHVDALRPGAGEPPPPPPRPDIDRVRPLENGEARALSHGAVYHPWLLAGGGSGGVAATAPDGAAIGVLARRAALRGAWVAPANEPLRGVVALATESPREALPQLQAAQINEIRREPAGFLALSADTLSLEEETRPIGVRRLLTVLRRLALRHGTEYVFETSDEALRRAARLGFEELLTLLFRLGALAGATSGEAFQVVTGSPPNTSAGLNRGELVVELRVAPSRPLQFLTVRLLHSAERGLLVEGV